MKFVTLVSHNNWGHSYFYPKGQGLTKAGTCDTENGFKLKTGQKVHVRWPDETIEEVTIEMKAVNRRISDMGHSYDVTDHVPVFGATFQGKPLVLDLVGMDICPDGLTRGP